MSSTPLESILRRRFGALAVSQADAIHAQSVLRLLLAQDGSTTRLCEAVAGGPVQLHVVAQAVTDDVPSSVRATLEGPHFIERVTFLAAHGEVMMDNLTYIALAGLDADLRRDLEAGTAPIGHLLAPLWVRRSALAFAQDLLARLWHQVGLPDSNASRVYKIETAQRPLMVIAETYRQGMLPSHAR
jgi:chorismate-pyruvate lyase